MKRAPRTKDARATAYHEAGHAVMAWHEGVRINAVSVMPSPESWGMTDHANPLLGVPLGQLDSGADAGREVRAKRPGLRLRLPQGSSNTSGRLRHGCGGMGRV